LNEFLRQKATWLDGAQIQQTLFTSLYLAKEDHQTSNAWFQTYLKYLKFLYFSYVEMMRTSTVIREEDAAMPPFHNKSFDFNALEMERELSEKIEQLEESKDQKE
jgi:hypothetical protein